jgi:hypothetical protein
MSKDSTKAALNRYFAKQARQTDREMTGVTRKNGRPEFELTAKPCFKWFESNGWSMSIVESKAVFNQDAGRFVDGQAEAGFPDSVGCCPNGLGAFVEFKAPGRRSTIRPGQYEFLLEKATKGCFAVCTDSVEYLKKTWTEFVHLSKMDRQLAINFLRRELPVPPAFRRQVSDENALPFE